MLDDGSCPLRNNKNAQILLDYCAHRLSPSAVSTLEAHIGTCISCQQFCDRQQITWHALDTWGTAELSPGFDVRFREKLEAEAARPFFARAGDWFQDVSFKPAIPIAAMFLVLMLGWRFLQSHRPPTIPQPEVIQIEKTISDLEMLEQLQLPSE